MKTFHRESEGNCLSREKLSRKWLIFFPVYFCALVPMGQGNIGTTRLAKIWKIEIE